MNFQDIKFVLNFDEYDESTIKNAFNKSKSILNWQLDENLNAKLIEDDIHYHTKDVSDLKRNEIEEIISSFFNFTFNDVFDIELYRFLILKNNKNIKVLANINSLIFNYASLNDFYKIFEDLSEIYPEYDLDLYYKDIESYFNSSDFETDSIYWKNHIASSGNYIRFYNLNNQHYKSQTINVNKSSVSSFIKNHDCSILNFYGSIFSLYLSFIDRMDGCLLKTTFTAQKNNLNTNTLLKIDIKKNNSFNDLLNEFDSSFRNAMNHTEVDVDHYFDENVSYYSIHDFSNLYENIDIYNGENSALTLNIYKDYLEIVYNSDLFSDVYIEHMVKNIENLIDEVFNSPEKELSDINIISDEEKSLLDNFCKGDYAEVDEDEVLCEVFRKHAINDPEAIAVDDGVNQVTYGELEKSSNSIAHDLKENYNITSKSRVALILKRDYHFPEMVLALNKIGASSIPIDPIYPIKRIELMLNIADADCIISTEELENLNDFKIDVILIEDLNTDNEVDFNITCKIEDLFLILFTSGTTGIPKGVMINNKQVVGLTLSFKNIFGFSYGEVCGCYLSFSFIASCLIYATFYLGGCCRIFNENEQKDSLLLVKTLKEKHINNLILPPTIGIPIFQNDDLKLDYLVLAGAKLNELAKKDSNTQLVNFYGTTEIAFAITKIYDSDDIDNDNVTIGRPVTNTWAYILDKNNKQMPIGVPGEICISSKYISPGYIHNPELTKESFVENPYVTCEDNRIMYRTGDIGFYNFEGEVEIIGREDDQLSVRGFRIEKEEILNTIRNFNEITDVYIDVENDNLIAYYTSDDEFNIKNVEDALKMDLPYYMVPSLFIKLDKIPLNMNGKINKEKLKSIVNNENIEIADEVIGGVVDAFKKVLNLDSVLIDDDFIRLGGNSLSAMKLQLILKEKFGVSLSSNELLSLSTPKDIADHIKYNFKVHSVVDESKYTFDELCPLSESQLNVYLDESVNNMGTAYNNPFKIDFKNNFSADEIKKSLVKLFEVFPILKARITNEDGLYLNFDAQVEIKEGTLKDMESFVRPFELDKSLSRFLIVESESVLCFDCHHVIFDGTSINVLLECLVSVLNGGSSDYVDDGFLRQLSIEENINQDYLVDARDFFDKMLVDKDEVYELLPSIDCDDEIEYIDTFDVDKIELDSFLRSHSITHNQFFSSIFAYTLSRFAGSDKVLFNLIENGRGYMDLSNSVGMFVKTLPVLMDCSNQNVSSFLDYSSSLINSVMKYDLYPFRILANEYDLNIDVMFQYAHDIFEQFNNDFLSAQSLRHDSLSDLSFFIYDRLEDIFEVRVLYSNKFSRDFVKHFVDSFKLVLDSIIHVDELSDIDYISDSDLEILDIYNKTEHVLRYDDILDAFNENLSNNPNYNLIYYNENVYTYAEGAFIADKLSNTLKNMDVNKQDCVAFLVERSELYMFSVLGILSTGAVYVPLDDVHPNDHIQFILEDTESKVVIVDDETIERARMLVNESVVLLNISDLMKGDIGTLDTLPVVYGDLACILYTSGTTGIPKGVKITRKSVLNLAEFYTDKYNLSNEDVYGLFSPISFDAGPQAIFQSIYAGACLSIIPEDIKLNINKLNEFFIKENVTHTFIPTQVSKFFIENVNQTSLKNLSVGGEKLGNIESPQDYHLIDEFGPTEAFAFISSIDNSDKIDGSSVGYLNYNTKAYILDNEGRQVPVGAAGELYLAGYQIADGYLNRDEETEKSFLVNPFDDSDNYEVLYRSGDIVRLLPDGSLAIVGRHDSQAKIRGNRVELSEIEAVIREIDYVDDVCVQTIRNMDNYELVAYVVLSDEISDLKDYICDYVGVHKPDYMVPSYIISLDSIPLTVNGKVDRRALPEVDISSLSAEYVAPTNETEKHIVNVFEVVFNQKGIGLNDDFVSLGGDSITAIRVISLLEKEGISCNARDVLDYKTPYLIAQNVEKISKISYDATEGEVDLLPIQSYFFDQVNENDFSQEFILKSKVDLDLGTLQRAFNELTNIHDILRANYKCNDDGDAVQEILPLGTRVCEIKEYTSNDLHASLGNIVKESKESLDIGSDLIRVSLVHYNGEDYVVFVIHHLIIDGVSWSILIDDLAYIITQIKENKEINLLRPYPYKNWVEDVKSLVSDVSEDEKQHWIELNNLLDDTIIKCKSKGFIFDVDVMFGVDNLWMLSEEEYWALAISRAYKKTYDEDIIFNRESYGRDENLADITRTIGWFTSQYPILVDVGDGYDDISLMEDAYSVKKAFGDVSHLGLNYGSLIYNVHELEYKHCPVTFNFLSSEFSFENELFESIKPQLDSAGELEFVDLGRESFGITLNVSRVDDSYVVSGDYADGTYLGEKFSEFVENIKHELKFLGSYEPEKIVCALSESQLGIYLDEIVNDMGTAYSVLGVLECGDYSIEEIKNAINALIDKHPVLCGRVVDGDVLLLVCDSYPSIEVVVSDDYSELIWPFDLNESLARFFIIEDNNSKFIFYDMHHIISDAASHTIINKELSLALEGKLDDSVDFGFVYASRDSFEAKFESIYDEAHEFYESSLCDVDDAGFLLDDVVGVNNSIKLPIRGIRENVESFVHEYGITVGNFLNAVFAYTYSRFTGSDNVYYTFTEHGRHETYLEDALGMYTRTIPIVVDCENKSIRDYLSYVSDLILDSMRYSDYPFRLLASEFDLDNSVAFEYNFDLNDVFDIGDELIIEDIGIDLVSDFLCVVNDLNDGYLVTIQSSHNYSDDTIIRFLNIFKKVLMEMFDKTDLADIDYTSVSDLELLDSYNRTEYDLVYADVLDAFNNNLSRYPNNKLVSYNAISYSYGEGAFIADRIACKLTDLGVVSGDCVGFLVPRSELYMFSVLGILSCGGVYVPLDDNLPDERLSFMLDDIKSKVVIVSDETYGRVNNLVDDEVILLNISTIVNNEIGSLSSLPIVYGDLACILYTSGTSGIPKGVKITRKGIVNLVTAYGDKYGLGNGDVYGLFSNIGFDAALLAIMVVLYSGACLSIVPDEFRLDINALNDYFINQNVTHTLITSQVAKLFMENIENTSLEVLLAGGEKLGEVESPDDYLLVDAFGPTEACVFISSIKNYDKIDSSSIGMLTYNTKAYILDNEDRRVPVGAVGELCLAGYQIADGYLNREEETQNAFIDNPFDSSADYDVLYRTGDMVCLLSDGSLGLVGRRDSQVKIRGNRVELTEVEAVIRELDYVDDVCVETIRNMDNYELVAYIVVSDEVSNLKGHICDYVGVHKPDYMVPSFVIKLDSIPLNVNGKVDRRALPEVDISSLRAEYVAPRTETENNIVKAFEKVFNLEKISIYDDFTHLGGDSLIAIKLLEYLKNYNITAADILSLRTPYAIAKNIKEIEFDLDIYSIDSGCPLNEPQLNVYLDITANNKVDAYLIPILMEIPKKYGAEKISDALDEMLNVHPILGMRVSDDFEIPYLVKGSKPEKIVKSYDKEFIDNFLTKPFDLDNSLCRFLIIENDDNYKLYAVFHHIIFDALSENVFKQNIQSILNEQSLDIDDSFLKVSAFSQQISSTEEFDNAKSFYNSMLVDTDTAGVLLDDVSADGPGFTSAKLNVDINKFKEFINKNNINENVLFTGVFAYTLSRFTGKDKALFNIIENGRDRFGNFNSIGMYVNTLPVLADCKNQDIEYFMKYTADIVYSVTKFNYYPFRLLANDYDIDSNILFQFQPDWIKNNDDNVDIEDYDLLDNMDDLIADFNAEVIQKGQNYSLNILYSDKYSSDLINRFVESYNLILQDVIHVNNLSDINYITDRDIELLDDINQTETHFNHDDILDAFNDSLTKFRENVLVGYEEKSYTFGESAFVIDEISGRLNACGVNRQDFVALFVPRSEWFLLASMGVLTCGAIYVPIDISYPDERIILMLNDTQSKAVIVTDETEKEMTDIIEKNNLNMDIINVSDITVNGNLDHLDFVPVDVDDNACVLYTSGTTGVPKGVLVTRKAINNLVSWYIEETNFSSDDVYGMYCSYVFDMHTHALYSPVVTGGSLYVVPEDIRLDLNALNDYFVEHNCTHTYITSQVGKLFAESGMETTIKLLCFGGMKLGELNAPDSIGPFESYGPSENLAISTSIFANKRMDSSSIGSFISNVKGYVLDNEHRRIPLGAVGELYLAGKQLTPGYLNRDEENEKAFFDNPFDDKDGYERIYATGDMVRVLPDGTLGIVGRQDSQVKIRGNRVELTEVESIIRKIDYVEDVTVQTIKNQNNNELVAYVVLSKETDNIWNVVRDYVGKNKPDYMIPSYVIELDNIPLNVNGKVYKHALPPVNTDSLRAEYIAPRNEKEKNVVKAFEKVFNIENISIHDDFIHLGGDSLIAIKLLNNLDSDSITMADILKLRTPESIAKNMDDLSFDLDIYSMEEGCPLNAAQINVLADVTIYNKKNAYHISNFIKIPKKYSLEKILDALDKLLEAHPILSMRLSKNYEVNEENDMSNLELIQDSISIAKKFGIKDITEIVKSYGLRNVKGLYNMLQTAMKLLKGEYPYLIKGEKPPISVHKFDKDIIIDFVSESLDLYDKLSKFMVIESDDSYYLFYVIHHIIFDATSQRVFYKNLQTFLDGGSVDLDDTYLKVSAFTHHMKNTEKFDEASEFYESLLADVNEAGILTEENPSATGYKMNRYDFEIDEKKLNSYLKNVGISANVLFTSVFAYALSKIVEKDKVIFTMIENGRDRFNEDFIDMTSNVMPLLIDCKDQSINTFLENNADMIYGTMKHSYYPILLLYQKYNFEVKTLFQYMPDWVSYEIEDIEDISSSEIINHVLNSFNDFLSELFVQVNQKDEKISLIIVNSKRYSDEMIKDFKDNYISILLNIIRTDTSSNLSNILKDDFNN